MTRLEIELALAKFLIESPRTVVELYELLGNDGKNCPDTIARTLNQMRKKGLIHGEFSEEKSAWVYWADKE